MFVLDCLCLTAARPDAFVPASFIMILIQIVISTVADSNPVPATIRRQGGTVHEVTSFRSAVAGLRSGSVADLFFSCRSSTAITA